MADFHLSVGCLLPIMNDIKVEDPMMQVLKKDIIITHPCGTKRYHIILSDIVNCTSYSMISVRANERLEPYSIIKLKKYETGLINRSASPKKALLILEWVMMVKGRKIGKTIIGAPSPVEEEESFRISQNRDQLSAGCLWIIMDDQKVRDPVMQVLDTRKVRSNLTDSVTDKEYYRLVLSDGVNSTSLAMYTAQANSPELETYSVIRLKKYITSEIKFSASDRKRTILLIVEKEVIVDGNGTGNKTIGDPKSID